MAPKSIALLLCGLLAMLCGPHLASGSPPGIPEYSPAYSPKPEQSYSASTCNGADMTQSDFVDNIQATLGIDADYSDIGELETYINFTNAGTLLANASMALNLAEAESILGAMKSQLLQDVAASENTWMGLFNSVNFTSVGQILSTLNTSLSLQELSTVGSELITAVDTTGVGYFLGNFTVENDLSVFGSQLNQLLQTVNYTQVGVVLEAIPSVIDLPMAATIVGQIVGNANFTQSGDVLNDYIASLGTLLQGCGADLNTTTTAGGY